MTDAGPTAQEPRPSTGRRPFKNRGTRRAALGAAGFLVVVGAFVTGTEMNPAPGPVQPFSSTAQDAYTHEQSLRQAAENDAVARFKEMLGAMDRGDYGQAANFFSDQALYRVVEKQTGKIPNHDSFARRHQYIVDELRTIGKQSPANIFGYLAQDPGSVAPEDITSNIQTGKIFSVFVAFGENAAQLPGGPDVLNCAIEGGIELQRDPDTGEFVVNETPDIVFLQMPDCKAPPQDRSQWPGAGQQGPIVGSTSPSRRAPLQLVPPSGTATPTPTASRPAR